MENSTKIYTLSCPITNEVRYIGITTKQLSVRLYYHLMDKSPGSKKSEWIGYLNSLGCVPIIEIIEEVKDGNFAEIEIYWIQQFKSWGFDLLNVICNYKFKTIADKNKETARDLAFKKFHVYDMKLNYKCFDNITNLSNFFGIGEYAIEKNIDSGYLYKKNYVISSIELTPIQIGNVFIKCINSKRISCFLRQRR